MTTTPPADQIDTVWLAADTTWPVDYSLETAHEAVAVVKLHANAGYHLAVHTDGRWQVTRWISHNTVAEALSLVPAIVAKHLGMQA